ncbi:MAG: PH domain-containing protein [bacterium]|nr:PH domain-containing protein [bacterium]
MSHRWALKKGTPLLLAFLLVSILSLAISIGLVSYIQDEFLKKSSELGLLIISILSFLIWLARFLLLELELRCYYYGVESGHFVFSKGIFLKQRASFPLSRITDLYVDRTFGDFIFGLYNLHVSTPTVHSGEFARVLGLNKKNVDGLQRRLSQLVEEGDFHIENIDNFVSNLAERGSRLGGGGSAANKRSSSSKYAQHYDEDDSAEMNSPAAASRSSRTSSRISSSRKTSRF